MAANTNSYELKCRDIKTAFKFILLYEITAKGLISHRFIYSIERILENSLLKLPINCFVFEQTNNFIIQIIAKIIYFFEIIRFFMTEANETSYNFHIHSFFNSLVI